MSMSHILKGLEFLNLLFGDDSRTTLEHIGQFIIQCGEASTNDIYNLRLFYLSLSGDVFT